MQLLRRKMDNFESTASDVIVTGNPGCMIQLQHGINQRKLEAQVVHTATFLRRMYVG
jgi:glycolate oxidase iron-sulfur subunit